MTVSSGAYAENLQCKNSYKIFEGIYSDFLSVSNGPEVNLTLLGQLESKYDYSRLFTRNHPGQLYSNGDWVSVDEYNDQIILSHAIRLGSRTKYLGIKLKKSKANFLSGVGEVCVVPTEVKLLYLDKEIINRFDNIFVRDLKNNTWRVFMYIGIEHKKDFDEFFPDFPKSVKLSERYSTLDPSFGESIKRTAEIYKAYDIKLTPEMIEQRKEARRIINERRKANGFE